MSFMFLQLTAVMACVVAAVSENCQNVDVVDRSLRDDYCDQPLFVTFTPDIEELRLVDNICHTYFPLPDDPNTFQIYISRVFCDGSNDIFTQIGTQLEIGTTRKATPFRTFTDQIFGYAGCDTYLVYRCCQFPAGCNPAANAGFSVDIYGISASCRPIGLSCLRKVQEIIRDQGLPDQEYYVLPMKLPHRCVTQQLCVLPPNPFTDIKRPSVGLL